MVAHKAISGFNMRVIGYDPYAGVEAAKLGVTQLPDMAQVLAQSDFVSLHLPLTPITKGLIGERELAVMKESGYLISAARGGIVDETALERALQSGKLAGAALDVFEEEPPAPGHPLFALDQVIVTPHNAALTKEATERMSLHAAISIDEVLSGKTPSWPVNRPPFRKDGKGEGL
jgi:D-3-phosphoglycerate dehydrogenase